MSDANLLILTAAAIAALHTVLGPDHYLVFTAMGKARGWGLAKTLRVTTVCGLGHIFGSIALGAIGLAIGAQLGNLVAIEGLRGNLASWALLSFGLVYLAWGIKQIGRNKSHEHVHAHGDLVHSHSHDHHGEHAHPHIERAGHSITPWALFIVFVLGPCEALIPLFMYPAAEHNAALVFSVAAIFGGVTLATMLAGVVVTTIGLNKFRMPAPGRRYAHAAAGGSIAVCGVATTFLGL